MSSKIVAERNRRTLLELVLTPGNDVCADCKARAPRWASHNLGIFICVSCASIHRKIGTHVTKVKSITLDEWSKEQVEVMKERGNIKSNALYNPNETRHPPPTNMMDSERDSELEKFIRAKYEFKRFMDRMSGTTSKQVVTDLPATSMNPRPRTTPLADAAQIGRRTSPRPVPPPKTPENMPPRLKLHPSATTPSLTHSVPLPTRSASQPLPPPIGSDNLPVPSLPKKSTAMQPSVNKAAGGVWEDLVSLQDHPQTSSLPLQYNSITSLQSQPQVPVQQHPLMPGNGPNPFSTLSLGQVNTTAQFVASPMSVSTPTGQFPFVSSAPLSSPAFHLGATNPFSQTPLLSSPATTMNGTVLSTGSNPFSPSAVPMPMSAPATPSMQPVMALPTGNSLHTSPLLYVPSQPSTPSFPSAPFPATPPAMAGLGQNPFTTIGAPGQVPLAVNGSINPFSAIHVGQPGFFGTSPQTAYGTTVLNQQQQQPGPPPGFGGWVGRGSQGAF